MLELIAERQFPSPYMLRGQALAAALTRKGRAVEPSTITTKLGDQPGNKAQS